MNKETILSKKIDDEKLKNIGLYLLAFFIPTVLMIIVFIFIKVYPFGENLYLPVDAFGQYSSYLQYFRNLFLGNGSIIYSLSRGLGGEMYGLFAYYLLSPFNLVVLLFSKTNITISFDIIYILKIASCSLSMVYYLNRRKKADFANLIFGIMYGLSAYSITYGFNIMWQDGMILLPLVVAGIDDLIDGEKGILYIITLSLCLLTNYYIGFMICVFSLIYFIYKIILEENKSFKTIGKFACFSICAIFISGIILIPIFIGLKGGRADFSFSNINFNTNFEFEKIFSKFFTNSFNLEELKNNSMPEVFCGVLANVLVMLYFLNSKIKLKEKLLSLGVLTIFILSFCINGANLLWTMGNTPAWYMYRYAFLFVFFFIKLAQKSLENIKMRNFILENNFGYFNLFYNCYIYISTKIRAFK